MILEARTKEKMYVKKKKIYLCIWASNTIWKIECIVWKKRTSVE